MSYRIQTELTEHAPLKEKVLFHAKFLRHLQRRKLDPDARGKTQWTMEFISEQGRFTIIWLRKPESAATGNGPVRFNRERYLGMAVIKFSKTDIEIGGPLLISGDWAAIEAQQAEKVS